MDEVMKLYEPIQAAYQANNAWSAEQAEKAMKWQEEMSNTAHQREVADLKAAGLNPVLSAGGSGATTGSGMAAQRSDSNVDAIYGLASKALQASIDQSKAMQNTAKYISGAAGSSNPVFAESNEHPVDISPFTDNPVVNALEDFLYKIFGIKQDDVDEALQWTADKVDQLSKSKFAKDVKTFLSGNTKAIKNLLSDDPASVQSGKDFFKADLNHNGSLDQSELAKWAYSHNGEIPGSKYKGKSGKF